MRCPVCKKRQAVSHSIFGFIPCDNCQQRRGALKGPDIPVEMVGDSIKQQRKEFADDIIQPYRSGELSKEYLNKYGTKNIKPTKEQVKKAKEVWK